MTNFIFINSKLEKADIIFIHGGLYPEIAETAAKLWENRYAKKYYQQENIVLKRATLKVLNQNLIDIIQHIYLSGNLKILLKSY